jgi:dienelactone hydrolase
MNTQEDNKREEAGNAAGRQAVPVDCIPLILIRADSWRFVDLLPLSGVTMRFVCCLAVLVAWAGRAVAQAPKAPEPIVLGEALVIRPVGTSGRAPLHLDLLEAEIVAGRWKAPREGDKIELLGGKEAAWEKASAGKGGTLKHAALRGGYAYWAVPSDTERVMILEASGHLMAYVNGEPRTGDLYGYGYVRLPVLLRKGTNDLLFLAGRGTLRARLVAPKSDIYLEGADALLPDLLEGESSWMSWAAMVVVNATTRTQENVHLIVQGPQQALSTRVPPMPPLSVRKVPFLLPKLSAKKDGAPAAIAVQRSEGGKLDNFGGFKFTVWGRRPDETYRRTFVSSIDGSVQYYAVNPARPLGKDAPPPALFLTLHGASVEAYGQANAYASKTWGHIVAPTNRRPYGFDWEDWGRLDAMEVLELARKELRTDPQRTYLTGHSMGGHGTWHLGATFPDRFAAIGPSAGWVSFWTYPPVKRAEIKGPVDELLRRASNPSDTLLLATNYLHHGVYVLHGDADDNVPVAQARLMKQLLEKVHRDFHYHEQPKARHWWDVSPEPGTDCVDWAPMFDLFARRVIPRPEAVRQVRFVTVNPGNSARSHWVTIEAQQKALKSSGVLIQCDPVLRRFLGKTDNVARLTLDLGHLRPGPDVTFELDGQKAEKVPWPDAGKLRLQREGEKWSAAGPPAPGHKGPHRYGPFRDVFRNRMLFVYGTKGTPAENAWALAKARYDAETFWYRGNGSVDVIADTAFQTAETAERNVVLYGNADTNAAWGVLLKDSPVQLRRGAVTVGERKLTGEHLACLFLRPRPGSERACVGVVGGTGLAGMRLTDRLPYFVSGVAYPDCIVLGPETLREGVNGVRVAGYFGLDWGVGSGEFAWGARRAEAHGPAPDSTPSVVAAEVRAYCR